MSDRELDISTVKDETTTLYYHPVTQLRQTASLLKPKNQPVTNCTLKI
jgi:hypothetical protein